MQLDIIVSLCLLYTLVCLLDIGLYWQILLVFFKYKLSTQQQEEDHKTKPVQSLYKILIECRYK